MPRKRIGFDGYVWWLDRWRGSYSRAQLDLAARGLYRELCEWVFTCRGRGLTGIPFGTRNERQEVLRMVAITSREWSRNWPKVAPYFEVVDGHLTHSTVNEMAAYVEKQAEKGEQNKGRKRYVKGGANGTFKGGSGTGTGTGTSSSSSKTQKKEPPAPKGAEFVPELVERWNEFASRHELPLVLASLKSDDRRVRAYRKRLKEHPEFWEALEAAVSNRSEFYREKHQPTFSQATRRAYFEEKILGREMCELEDSEADRERAELEELCRRFEGGGNGG